ncbi:hypothetical protein GF373_05945 [bacterium]|nr:hypothetical protein [bacterium]
MKHFFTTFFSFLVILSAGCASAENPADWVKEDLIVFKKNGGWCWYQDERAIADGDALLIGSVSSPAGDIQLTQYHIETGKTRHVVLHAGLQSDDHNVPALLTLPNGRYLAMYSTHGSDRLMRWRLSAKPGDALHWEEEKSLDVGAGATYANVFQLAAEGNRVYCFHRGRGWDPNYLISDDQGRTFTYGGRLLRNKAEKPRKRPYVKYASNNQDAIHFVTTEGHPQILGETSIYHGYYKNGKIHRSDGSVVGALGSEKIYPTSLTKIFAGNKSKEAWTIDLHLDAKGRPYTVFSVHHSNADHRYYYARWDGKAWRVHEIAYGGNHLYDGQYHYTGLVALHPHNPHELFISTDVDPKTGELLISQADGKRHYEIFRGITKNNGKTWRWTPLTQNSTVDNIRPIIPIREAEDTCVLWLRGAYTTYQNYRLDVVGMKYRSF